MLTTAHNLTTALKANGGFTHRIGSISDPRPGDHLYAVAYSKDTERTYSLETFSPEDLVDYIVDHAAELTQDGVHLGAWVENGTVFLDCSIVLDNEADAHTIARLNDQIAIFSFAAMESIPTWKTAPTSKVIN